MKTKTLIAIAGIVITPLFGAFAQPEPGPDAQFGDQGQAAPANVSPAVADIVNMAAAGKSEQELIAHIQNSPNSFSIGADDVIYLKDVGLSSAVINAMLTHNSGGQAAAPLMQPEEPPRAPQEPPLVTAPNVPTQRSYVETSPPQVYETAPPVEVNYFYSDLSPYGTWVQLDGVGWCWQPRAVVINRSWQPYCDSGHWVWTDAGWYWQSDYSWGWAPFHYGRWYRHERCGWVWTPDTVWGPSWVIWRTGGDYCGWAPCPPGAIFDVRLGGWRYHGAHVSASFDFGLGFNHFTFVSMRDFGHRDLGRYRAPRTEVTRIYNRTTVINNYTVNNNRVVNRGLPVERVASASHTEFRQVAVRDVSGGVRTGERIRTDRGDRTAVVYRHELTAPPKIERVQVQKVDDRHPIVHQTPVVSTRTERSGSFSGTGSQSFDRNGRTSFDRNGTQQRSTFDRSQPNSAYDRTQPAPRTSDNRRDTGRSATQPNFPDARRESGRSTPQPAAPDTRRETTRPPQTYSTPDTRRDNNRSPQTYSAPETRSQPAPTVDRSPARTYSTPTYSAPDTRREQSDPRSSRADEVRSSRSYESPGHYQPKTFQAPESRSSSRESAPARENRDSRDDRGSRSKRDDR